VGGVFRHVKFSFLLGNVDGKGRGKEGPGLGTVSEGEGEGEKGSWTRKNQLSGGMRKKSAAHTFINKWTNRSKRP